MGRILTGNAAGGLLAFGPQVIIDASQSSSAGDFAQRSAYSQPTNAVAFVAGAGAAAIATAFAAPVVVVIVASIGAGMVAQLIMSKSGLDQTIGDFFTGK